MEPKTTSESANKPIVTSKPAEPDHVKGEGKSKPGKTADEKKSPDGDVKRSESKTVLPEDVDGPGGPQDRQLNHALIRQPRRGQPIAGAGGRYEVDEEDA